MASSSCQNKSIILVTGGTGESTIGSSFPYSSLLMRSILLLSAHTHSIHSGFIASHVIDTLLRAPLDYYVRFTSRAVNRADATLDYFGKRYGRHRIQAVVIEDLEADGAYDQAVKGAFNKRSRESSSSLIVVDTRYLHF